jgi:hypothetical protein
VAGTWTGTVVLTGASGGECVGQVYQTAPPFGSVDYVTAVIQQSGSNLTATVTSNRIGYSCQYSGAAGSSTFTLNTSCRVGLGIKCADGALRFEELATISYSGDVSANSAVGTETETWNVSVFNSPAVIGILTLNNTFSLTR